MNRLENELVIRNGEVLLPSGELSRADILIRDGLITGIGRPLKAKAEIDASGGLVLPGLIDLHTHGMGFESVESENLEEYARLEASRGATTFYPTYFGPPEKTAKLMALHRRHTDELRRTPQIGGFRLESPYLACPGGGLKKDLSPITPEMTDLLLQAGGGTYKDLGCLAGIDGAIDLIHQLVAKGIICSLAHTHATIEQARAAVDAGARLVTHFFNTFLVPQEKELGVFPVGLVDYLLIEDRVTCEIIADGTHVEPMSIEKALRCKTANNISFVTDSNFGAGLPAGDYELPSGHGLARISDGYHGVRLINRDMTLAGSALTPIDAFRKAIELFHENIAIASRVCSRTPARLMGLNKGEISIGKDADLIIVRSDFSLRYTITAGKIVYQAEG